MNTPKILFYVLISFFFSACYGQQMKSITIDSEIKNVQPMTGIVFWPSNSKINTDAITLEYSYMSYADVMEGKDTYQWQVVDDLLDEIKGRNHQAIMRFRFSYPGKTTTVPQYIKDMEDYQETEGLSEGKKTWFPDWTHSELKRFTLDFYEKFAARYDNDARLAFVQTGFGLWAEYHIYDGPFELGQTFPDKAFQSQFFKKMDTTFRQTHWSVSIDAASDTYSPLRSQTELKNINFGLFDDSFMHKNHSDYNESSWNFFGRERYGWVPAGGEFSYYTTHDQKSVLIPHTGAHGEPFEKAVERFHMSYIIGNDQATYHTMERIKEASRYMGYRFKINSFLSKSGESVVEVQNVGVAPIYYDAYVAVNGIRAAETLKFLLPGEKIICHIASGGESPELTIESDRILATQKIEFYGTENTPYVYEQKEPEPVPVTLGAVGIEDDPFFVDLDNGLIILSAIKGEFETVYLYDLSGELMFSRSKIDRLDHFVFDPGKLKQAIYVIKTNLGTRKVLIN